MRKFLLLILLSPSLFLSGQTKEVPFTLADRDRIIRTEVEIASLRNEMKTEIGSLRNEMDLLRNEINYKFESLQTFLFWGFGILFSMMVFLFGFVLWDRRTTVAPVKKENKRIIEALTEYSKENPKLAEILRSAGIL